MKNRKMTCGVWRRGQVGGKERRRGGDRGEERRGEVRDTVKKDVRF